MLNFRKEADTLKAEEFRLSTCPVCKSYVCHMYFMQDSKTKKQSKWFSCSCGIVFQDKKPDKVYDKKYWDDYNKHGSKLRDPYEFPVRIYAPIIEELIYGRRALIVGRPTTHQEEALEARGWVVNTIDKNLESPSGIRHTFADFESYEFGGETKFNMIWMYHTLECFNNPLTALSKCRELLTEDGILFIGTPDTDFINTRGSSSFIHWKPEMHNLMWNKRSLTSHLEKLGFSVIMARQNYGHRFPAWDDLHLLAQVKFF